MSETLKNWLAAKPLLLAILGGKGGIGKSLTAQLMTAALRGYMLKVRMIDTDHTNSSSRSIDTTAHMVRLAATEARGYISVHLDSLKSGTADALVMDTGAQEDGLVKDILSWLATESRNAGALFVPVLPLTLSSHNQARSVAVAQHAQQVGAPVLFVRNLGQGRVGSDYERWDKTSTRKAVLEAGAVEVVLPDLGARWTDEAAGFGLSLADAAKGNFAKIVEEAQASGADLNKAQARAKSASEVFDPGVRAWLSIYLGEVGDTLLTGVKDAVDLRHRLNAKR